MVNYPKSVSPRSVVLSIDPYSVVKDFLSKRKERKDLDALVGKLYEVRTTGTVVRGELSGFSRVGKSLWLTMETQDGSIKISFESVQSMQEISAKTELHYPPQSSQGEQESNALPESQLSDLQQITRNQMQEERLQFAEVWCTKFDGFFSKFLDAQDAPNLRKKISDQEITPLLINVPTYDGVFSDSIKGRMLRLVRHMADHLIQEDTEYKRQYISWLSRVLWKGDESVLKYAADDLDLKDVLDSLVKNPMWKNDYTLLEARQQLHRNSEAFATMLIDGAINEQTDDEFLGLRNRIDLRSLKTKDKAGFDQLRNHVYDVMMREDGKNQTRYARAEYFYDLMETMP